MLRAYFDDSGKESVGQFVCMAGYLAVGEMWNVFTTAWQHAILKYGISGIHMRDLIPLQGEYGQLGWDTQKRDEVISHFIEIIKTTQLIGFGVGVDGSAWRELRKLNEKVPNVQTFCFSRIMRMLIDRLKAAAPRDFLSLYFDTDPEFGAARLKLFDHLRGKDPDARRYLLSLTFADTSLFTGLQAADMLAWETRKELVQKAGGFTSTSRYQDLFTAMSGFQMQYHNELWNKNEIESRTAELIQVK